MNRQRLALALVAVARLLLPAAPRVAQQEQPRKVMKHHVLRGTIANINLAAQTFEVKTAPHRTVICYLDSKSVVHRDGKKVRLADIPEGSRVRCMCSEVSGGRHYSLELLVEPPKKARN